MTLGAVVGHLSMRILSQQETPKDVCCFNQEYQSHIEG